MLTDSTSTRKVDYIPKPEYMLKLKTMAKNPRIISNIGGSRFETCAEPLMKDPSSILSYMVLPESPFKPYNVDNIYIYFIDRDPVSLFTFSTTFVGTVTVTFLHCLQVFQTLQDSRKNVVSTTNQPTHFRGDQDFRHFLSLILHFFFIIIIGCCPHFL